MFLMSNPAWTVTTKRASLVVTKLKRTVFIKWLCILHNILPTLTEGIRRVKVQNNYEQSNVTWTQWAGSRQALGPCSSCWMGRWEGERSHGCGGGEGKWGTDIGVTNRWSEVDLLSYTLLPLAVTACWWCMWKDTHSERLLIFYLVHWECPILLLLLFQLIGTCVNNNFWKSSHKVQGLGRRLKGKWIQMHVAWADRCLRKKGAAQFPSDQ